MTVNYKHIKFLIHIVSLFAKVTGIDCCNCCLYATIAMQRIWLVRAACKMVTYKMNCDTMLPAHTCTLPQPLMRLMDAVRDKTQG